MFIKYPRTFHIQGSRETRDSHQDVLFSSLDGVVFIEEKLDGTQIGIRFDEEGEVQLQSRGQPLENHPEFALLRRWVHHHLDAFWDCLEDRYVLFGEWVYAKHTIFYDRLPHHFFEFDVFDTQHQVFLSTPARRALLFGAPIVSAPVLWSGSVEELAGGSRAGGRLQALSERPSVYRSLLWQETLSARAEMAHTSLAKALAETDPSDKGEGLYLKLERGGETVGRFKWIRRDFLRAIQASGSHWRDRPIIVQGLAPGVNIFIPWSSGLINTGDGF